jgi:uncharacterized membrane protein YeaQ/YmgE (transglycosylase-associated protein family)
MDLMSLFIFLLVGLAAGWGASALFAGGGRGVFADMLLGVLGAFFGGFLFNLLGVAAGTGLMGALISAFVGASALIFILRLIK